MSTVTRTDVAGPSSARRGAAAIAAGAALGLAIAHLVVNLSHFPADGSVWLLLGPVLTPSTLAGLLAVAAVSAGRHQNTRKAVRLGLILGAFVMWALAITMLVWTVLTRTPVILRPDGPGLWSLVGAPAFTVLASMPAPRHAALRPRPRHNANKSHGNVTHPGSVRY